MSDVVTNFGARWRITTLCTMWLTTTGLGGAAYALGWRSVLWILGWVVFTVMLALELRARWRKT